MSKIKMFVFFMIGVSFGIGAYFYPQMPAEMASHWNARGEVDGYMSKAAALFLMPALSLFFFMLFTLIPRIDPKRNNIENFREYFDGFLLVFEFFLFYLYLLTIAWSRGAHFNMTAYLLPAMGVLFYYVGILIEKARPNWFVGIRTPWTLSSDRVWEKTHKLGGKLFKISGIISILGALAGPLAIFFTLVPVIFSSLYLTVYSYREYAKEQREKK